MNVLNLTVSVLNVSPRVSQSELETLFSYCGTVEKIKLQRNEDSSQSAQVTFRQPFAYRTALLLNDVPVAGDPIQVLPSEDSADQTNSREHLRRDTKRNRDMESSPDPQDRGQVQASSPPNDMARLVYKTRSVISTAAKGTAKICSVIIPFAPLLTALFLLSRALPHLVEHALEEWIEHRDVPVQSA